VQNALIFCNRKSEVDILYKSLTRHKFSVGALHGDMSQPVRFATLEKFKAGELRLLCCSDVAARGLDIGGLSHVFNFDVPHHAEDYVHRIGRTGRAGREGRAFTIATPDDRLAVQSIEKLTGHPIPRIVIDGLDVVEWAEGDGRRRGRGKPAPRRSDAKPRAEPKPRAEAKPRGEARKPEPAAEAPLVEEGPRPARARRPEREAPRAAPAEPARETARPPRGDRPRDDRPRDDRQRDARPRDDRPRDDRPRDDRPRDDRPRDERRPRRDDDLGPSVLGFGDDIPAFMLVAARPKRHHADPAPHLPEDAEC
jgi:superfamily II DNA/RNA helicase